MKQLALVAALVAALSGCSRDLTVPETNSLAVVLPANSAAPRQRLQLAASGGAGTGFVYAFAPGGQRSGASATLTADGAYQAGERGLEEDTVQVTDSAGATATSRISVSAPLSLTPALSSVAPGGRVDFVASGGKPPYVLQLADGGQPFDGGVFFAAAPGGRVEVVRVSDATMDVLATAQALVSVGNELKVYPSTASVAPLESLSFIPLGGQPPYTFSLADAGSSGATAASVEPSTGRYVAGSNPGAGETGDVLLVTDANGQSVTAAIRVGPPLVAESTAQLVQPGVALTITASGGKPPYALAFQSKGNRSEGSVDSVALRYTPGTNTGASDLLQVTDAVGATVKLAPMTIGGKQIALAGGFLRLQSGDFDGNGTKDLAAFNWAFDRLTLVRTPAALEQSIEDIPLSAVSPSQFLVTDLNGDGRDDVVTAGPYGVDAFTARFDGSLDPTLKADAGPGSDSMMAREGQWLYRWSGAGCVGVQRVDLAALAQGSAVTQCLVPNLTAPLGVPLLLVGAGRAAGTPFVQWQVGPTPGARGALTPLEFRYLADTAPTTVTRSAQLPLPSGYQVWREFTSSEPLLSDPRRIGPDRMFVLVTPTDGGLARAWGVDTMGPSTAFPPAELSTSLSAVGLAATLTGDSSPLLAAWDSVTSIVALSKVDRDAGTTLVQRLDVGQHVVGAEFVDVNRDSLPDLVTLNLDKLTVTLADGDGRFGLRPRFGVIPTAYAPWPDLDGDGRTDLLIIDGRALRAWWGTDHQFALGPTTNLPFDPQGLIAGEFSGDGLADLLVTDAAGTMYFAPGTAPGAFGAPVPVLTSAGVAERGNVFSMRTADFGGAAPGPDVLIEGFTPGASSTTGIVLLRSGPSMARRVALTPPQGDCGFTAADVDGAGALDLLAACVVSNQTQLYKATSQGAGDTLTFSTWTAVGPPYSGYARQFVDVTGPATRRYLNAGTALLEVTTGTGAVSWTRQPVARPYNWAFLANLTPDAGTPELVTGTNAIPATSDQRVRVFALDGGAWVEKQVLEVGLLNPFGVSRQAGEPDDIVIGDFRTNSIVLRNDGTGTLR